MASHDSALAGRLSRPWLSPVLAGLLRLGRTVAFVYGPFRLPGAVGKRGRWLTLPYDCSQQYQAVKVFASRLHKAAAIDYICMRNMWEVEKNCRLSGGNDHRRVIGGQLQRLLAVDNVVGPGLGNGGGPGAAVVPGRKGKGKGDGGAGRSGSNGKLEGVRRHYPPRLLSANFLSLI